MSMTVSRATPAEATGNDDERQNHDRRHDGYLMLVHKMARLRLALEKAAAENAALRRQLAQIERENTVRKVLAPRTAQERAERVRTMLRDRASRNP
jgi:hypothetical protein